MRCVCFVRERIDDDRLGNRPTRVWGLLKKLHIDIVASISERWCPIGTVTCLGDSEKRSSFGSWRSRLQEHLGVRILEPAGVLVASPA